MEKEEDNEKEILSVPMCFVQFIELGFVSYVKVCCWN